MFGLMVQKYKDLKNVVEMEGFRGNLLVTLNESLLYRSHELQFTYYKSRSFSACLIYGLWDLYTR